MHRIAFIGDELTAAGFRLAGIRVFTPSSEDFVTLYETLREEAELLLLTESYARLIDAARRQQDQQAVSPLLLVIPDVARRSAPVDVGALLRDHLGMREAGA